MQNALTRWIQRNPIIIRAIVVIVVVAALRIAGLLHLVPTNWVHSEGDVQDWIERGLAALAAWSAMRKVTPVAAPRNDAGVPLVPTTITPPGKRSWPGGLQ
jgi:NhaP-type Na+/H+ or K+/H+ antiporter